MTQQLNAAIQSVPGWQTLSAADLLTAITETTYRKKPPAERVWSIAGVAKDFGTTVAETIYAALVASGLNGIAARFAATGLDATDPQWLANADALIAGPLAGLPVETQLGLKYIAHDAVTLFSDAVTEQEVADAKQSMIDEIRAINAKALFSERMTPNGDANAVWSQAWIDAEAV